jgi:nitrite reductase (NADH) small subunit
VTAVDGGFVPAEWVDVGAVADVPVLGARTVSFFGQEIAVFRAADDAVFALHDACPHKRGRLSQGIVHGHGVTCPLHGWVVGLADGRAQAPDEGCTRTVGVRIEAGRVLLRAGR